jgi:hypothetical protein
MALCRTDVNIRSVKVLQCGIYILWIFSYTVLVTVMCHLCCMWSQRHSMIFCNIKRIIYHKFFPPEVNQAFNSNALIENTKYLTRQLHFAPWQCTITQHLQWRLLVKKKYLCWNKHCAHLILSHVILEDNWLYLVPFSLPQTHFSR